ncbi:hypothetical protein CHLRE_16g660225v5 [Chlamydomonas reinhardtii]|uniref:Uncharacterized protein n=1 Tax=Chlamydomonas reinhardtii TaxID=3055 RepID=A0A2K3CTG6_CHLRE|nr:uncharacterized protein CHLRE_16g660225v5 [Chlamydomonas reinhardtii]PNW71582.1 hypothetical protein CHLRE_16g660225v5 [Chlamydomonas reinhardtii]
MSDLHMNSEDADDGSFLFPGLVHAMDHSARPSPAGSISSSGRAKRSLLYRCWRFDSSMHFSVRDLLVPVDDVPELEMCTSSHTYLLDRERITAAA